MICVLLGFELLFQAAVEGDAEEGDGGADDGVEYPEEVGGGVLVDDHVAAYLAPVQAVVPDFDGRHDLEGDNVEDEDVARVVAAIDEEALHDALVAVKPRGDVMDHQETDGAREG